MAGNPKQKVKLLFMAEIFLKYSDEKHCLPIKAIEEKLAEKGVICERKSIANDIAILKEAGMDIRKGNVPSRGFYLAERQFVMAELRMLIDAVQSSPFISRKKTRDLSEKLLSLTSESQAELLKSQVYTEVRKKSDNEEILHNIETIQNAINQGKKIRFIYHHRQLVNNIPVFDAGRDFVISPYATMWDSDKYYLVGNYEKYDDLSHYRIDRIKRVEILKDDARPFQQVCNYAEKFDVADYANRVFNMFSGENPEPIELECEMPLLDSIIETFGLNIPYKQISDDKFSVKVYAVANEGFARWVLNFAGGVVVKSPASLVQVLRKIVFKMNMTYR